MFQIGVFSRLSQVSIKTLRYYDEMGLLKPVRVDEWSGYRHYTLEQLPRLHRILALKDLGLSLEEIAVLLNRRLAPEQIRDLLDRKRAELQQRVQEEQARLARVEARLRQIEQEGEMSTYDVVIKKVAPQLVAAVRETIPDWDQVTPTFNRIFTEVCDYVVQNGGQFAGAFLDRWLDPEVPNSDMHVEAIAPIRSPIPESERVKVYELPGETVASAIHRGEFGLIGEALKEIVRWVEENGYRISGPMREIYLQYAREGDPADYVTEVQYPISPALSSA